MDLTIQNVYGLLIRSRLLSLDDVKAMFARWNQEAKESATNVAQFAKWMVANKYLTEYQASLLARGHADGFFLNQYKILDRLGKGRMAGVYKAQHETGPIVAIKVLPPSKAKEPGLLARFQREARMAVKLKHPNVVRTFQVGAAQQGSASEKLHYLVMEYIEGETLEDVLGRRKQFLPGEAVRLVYQALLGLEHLNEHNFVHRDLKPANLMLAYGAAPPAPDSTLAATVKILDMGLARTLSDETAPERSDEPMLTSESILLGTPDYMAPEQARDARQADIRSDIYSLGCVLYHLLGGHPPFPDTNIISQMIRHATETPRPLKELNPAVPDGLQQILNWMLAKDPAERYPTPDRAASALRVFLVAGAEPAPTPEADPHMRKYLTWLEIDARDAGAPALAGRAPPTGKAPAPLPAAVPLAAPPTQAAPLPPRPPASTVSAARPTVPAAKPEPPAKPAAQQNRQRPKSSPGRKKGKRKKSSSGSMKLPVAKTVAAPAPTLDVELVPLPPALKPGEQPLFSLPLTRRDLVLFGVGAATVAVGAGIGLLAAWLAGAFKKKEPRLDDED
ncbi:MAG: serine/threonine protein kinase [Planctomycetes bacterium]|nr:serine/threonine protein kinase [Planctomycetota bacterium]